MEEPTIQDTPPRPARRTPVTAQALRGLAADATALADLVPDDSEASCRAQLLALQLGNAAAALEAPLRAW